MNRKTAVVLLISVLLMSVLLCSCGADDIDISSYADGKIELRGIVSGRADSQTADMSDSVFITITDLKAMKCKTLKTESTSDKIGKILATGPELDTILAEYGVSKADFSKIRIFGSDGYDCRLQNDYFTTHELYFAFGIDGEPLDAESAPCRLIIPDSDSAYWVRMVTAIEFIR